MIVLLLIVSFLLIAALCLVSFVQLLYLESLRLRPRDLPAIEVFKDQIEPAIGMETEAGALSFAILKYSLVILVAIEMTAWVSNGRPLSWLNVIEALVATWLPMLAASHILPQFLYRRTQAEWLRRFVPALRLVSLLVRPLVLLIGFVQSLATPSGEMPGSEESPTPAENIEKLIDAGAEEGLIEEDDKKLIQSVVEFGDKTARQVMTPRPNIVAIRADATLEDLRRLVINEQYSRIPVFEKSVDDIVGFVHVRDMFEKDEDERRQRKVREIMRPIRFVPETKPVQTLMRDMQRDNTHMVIVVDEYGNTAGLATMEDLVEVILGEIRDEHEPGSDITPDGDGFIVSGSFDVARLYDLFGFRPEAETESTTIGGLVTEWLGRVPAAGEEVEREGLRLLVLSSSGLRVEQVRVSRAAPAGTEPEKVHNARNE